MDRNELIAETGRDDPEWTELDQRMFDEAMEEFLEMYEEKAGLEATAELLERLRKPEPPHET